MGKIKGQVQWKKWESGAFLTRKEAILANCYNCNGLEDGGVDCLGDNCPLYEYFPYRGVKSRFKKL